MTYTNFPDGITSMGVPLPNGSGPPLAHNVFFVSNRSGDGGNDANPGTMAQPWSTLDYAIGRCTAGRGDLIMVMEGHAETLATASAIAADVAGITIWGMGSEDSRPIFTFSATAATFAISAANVTIVNIVGKPSIDSVVSPFLITGAGCTLGLPGYEVEWQDASSSIEALRAVLTTTAADNLNINLRYRGFTAGDATANAIRLVGCANGRINIDAYGRVDATGWVEFLTTACTNVEVRGTFFTLSITNLSRNVVDTQGSSTWFVAGYDASAGASFSGGSAAAVASDDVSAITAAIGTITNSGGTATIGGVLGDVANVTLATRTGVPTADVATDNSIATTAGRKTDAAVQAASTVASLMAYAKGIVSRDTPQLARYTKANLASGAPTWTTGNSPITVFTVTGDVMVRVWGTGNSLTSTGATGTLAVGVAGLTTLLLGTTTINGTNFPVADVATGDVWVDTSPTAVAEAMVANNLVWVTIAGGADIIVTVATNSMTGGSIALYCEWIPLSAGATVVAIAPT